MQMLRFLRRHVVPVGLGVFGFLVIVYDAFSRVEQLWTWGIPGWGYEIGGFALLLAAVLRFFYEIHSRVEAIEGRADATPEPVEKQAPVATQSPPKPAPALPPTLPAVTVSTSPVAAPGPDYAAWDGVRRLQLFQAACLWNEETPPDRYEGLSGSALARLLMLQEAIEEGDLIIDGVWLISSSARRDAERPVTRPDLKRFAEKKGVRPKFLYPDAR